MEHRRRQDWARRYPPVLGALISMLLAVLVLPSALNVPQTNPTETLEFAPIPPEDEEPPPPEQANLESLSLGSSSTAPAGDAFGGVGPGPAQPPVPDGAGGLPVTKRCVGNPPRQTEDPMSPPCVAHFEGDNGGATHAGVTETEIRIAFVAGSSWLNEDDATQGAAPGSYCDLELPPDSGDPGCSARAFGGGQTDRDHVFVKNVRALTRYFNDRFQTYGRRLHVWIYWADDNNATPESRRADAVDIIDKVDPFATIDWASLRPGGHRDVYTEAMAAKGVVNIVNWDTQPRAFFQTHAGLIWSVYPDLEYWADQYVDYLCTRVAPYPVSHTSHEEWLGQPRRYGLITIDDPETTRYRLFGDRVTQQLATCGIQPAETVNLPNRADPTGATQRMAQLQGAGVTTILDAAGYIFYEVKAAAGMNYFPEIVVAGDGYVDANARGQALEPTVWRNAWLMTPFQLREDAAETTHWFRSCREGDPAMSRQDIVPYCQYFYRTMFMLAQAIQVAGPSLTPEAIESGMRAIPAVASTDPYQAACHFLRGEYGCIRDAVEEWWDPAETSPQDAAPGCYRVVNDGRRFWPGDWPEGDEVFTDQTDPCNGAGAFIAS